jgi:hypothetical protein
MIDFRDRIRPDWPELLEHIQTRARELGPRGVVVFDLDSTLLDNRPRQARIVREYGASHGRPALSACRPEHFDSGWNLRAALIRCGIPAPEVEGFFPDFRRFWQERFFTSEYCLDDVAVRGASAYVQRLAQTGTQIRYVTGRHEGMRPGTETAMRREGLPLAAPGRSISLIMKPDQAMDDDDFKRQAHVELGNLGSVIAAFDNEPIHANDYRTRFPDAWVVHLATDHSGRSAELLEGVQSIPHFQAPA